MSQIQIGLLRDHHSNFHFWQDSNLITTLNTSTTKNIASIMFILYAMVVTFVGAQFLRRRNLHRLAKAGEEGQLIAITEMTSWLSLIGTLTYIQKTGKVPGGKWGFVMLFSGAFVFGNQFVVNSWIVNELIHTDNHCTFQSGTITYINNGNNITPSTTFAATSTIYYAQLNAYKCGGPVGIYNKVPYNSSDFCPNDSEVLGSWTCMTEPNTTISYENWTSPESLYDFLGSQTFLFDEVWTTESQPNTSTGVIQGFLRWSANETNSSPDTWAVRASLATQLPQEAGSQRNLSNFECTLSNKNPGNWTPPIMPSELTLDAWSTPAFGDLIDSYADHFPTSLEFTLNKMVMVAGTGNRDIWQASDLLGESSFYGCNLTGTNVKFYIWIIVIILFVILVTMSFATLHMFFSDQRQPWKERLNPEIEKAEFAQLAPSRVHEWQLALLKQATNDKSITSKDFCHYSYGWLRESRKFCFHRSDAPKTVHLTGPTPPPKSPIMKQEVGYSIESVQSWPQNMY